MFTSGLCDNEGKIRIHLENNLRRTRNELHLSFRADVTLGEVADQIEAWTKEPSKLFARDEKKHQFCNYVICISALAVLAGFGALVMMILQVLGENTEAKNGEEPA